MAISVGDKLPEATFMVMTDDGPKPKTTDEIFAGRKVGLFAVPGAFTPGCHRTHMPGYVANEMALKEKGLDEIACTAVNDVFVMDHWAKALGADGKILMLADGSAEFAKKIGLDLDLVARGLGVRSKRYSMVVDNGVVKTLEIDDSGIEKSSAESMLACSF